MPIYTYTCAQCKAFVEHCTRIDEYKPLVRCPECKKHALERVYDGYGGFHLKGRDWPSRDLKRTGR